MNEDKYASMLKNAKDAIRFAQELSPSPIHDIKGVKDTVGLSDRTIRRKLMRLEELGLADYKRGKFTIKSEVVSQPHHVLRSIIPSLMSLKKARRFGRYYKPTDINFVKKNLPDGSIITLDYKVHELTGFQTPLDLHVYVDDMEDISKFLKSNRFREGRKGNVVLLPKIGSFDNLIERVFLDCVANGGRSFLDAAAIMLTYKDAIKTRVRFAGDTIWKVQEDMLPSNATH